MSAQETRVIRGVCFFFVKPGGEEGDWAIHYDDFTWKNCSLPYCVKCGAWLDPPEYRGIVAEPTFIDPHTKNKIPPCAPDNHERGRGTLFLPKGIHILENGDRVRIFSPNEPSTIVWEGTINLEQHSPCKEWVYGWWIHADQKNTPRETWATFFFQHYPSEILITRET